MSNGGPTRAKDRRRSRKPASSCKEPASKWIDRRMRPSVSGRSCNRILTPQECRIEATEAYAPAVPYRRIQARNALERDTKADEPYVCNYCRPPRKAAQG